jgi:hypothetical protein
MRRSAGGHGTRRLGRGFRGIVVIPVAQDAQDLKAPFAAFFIAGKDGDRPG